MNNRDELDDILTEARKKKRLKNVLGIVALVVLLSAVGISFHVKATAEQTAAMENKLAAAMAERSTLRKEKDDALAMMHRVVLTRILADSLPIKGLDVMKMNGDLYISGHIRNKGAREVNDIEVTVYGMAGEAVLFEKSFTARSSDGEPLLRGQKRRFQFKVDSPPVDATEVVVIITSIDFAEEGEI